MFLEVCILKNFAIFTRKHMCWSQFLIKLQTKACNFIKNRLQHMCFPVNAAKIFKNSFCYKTSLVAASDILLETT